MQPEFDAESERIYELPMEAVSNQHLRDLYANTVRRLHIQLLAAGVADFDAFMLAERFTFNYIVLRQKEMRLDGIGYVGNQQVALNKLWLELSREFSARVRSTRPDDNALLDKMKQIIYDTVAGQEPGLRRKLANEFSMAFEKEKL